MSAFTFTVPRVALSRPGIPVGTFRYRKGVGFQPLPTVKCVEVNFREGPNASRAVFEYISGNYHPDMIPIGFENAMPLRKIGNPAVLNTDDEIVVVALTPNGRYRFLFHGFAQVPETSFTSSHEAISIHAQGVEDRCWDEPIAYAVTRDAGDPGNPTKNVWTSNPVRFNPLVKKVTAGNQLTEGRGWEALNEQGLKYSPFIDPLINRTMNVEGKDVSVKQLWSLFSAVNYIFCTYNDNWRWVRTWEPEYLVRLLSVIVPKKGQYFDIIDESTFNVKPIKIPDTDVTTEAWPVAADKLLSANGFASCFRLGEQDGEPVTFLDIYKMNESLWTKHKDVYLQAWQDVLEPPLSNLGSAKFAGDISDIVNVVAVDTAPVIHEVGLILAPLWDIDSTDLDKPEREKFKSNHPDHKSYRDKYRLWGFDETGEGHLEPTFSAPNPTTGLITFEQFTMVYTVASLTPIFGVDEEGNPRFVQRRRPPLDTLWTKDKLGEELKAELYVSLDYNGSVPAVWDGKTGTWFRVGSSFRVCEDRIGIRVTESDPNAWHVGKMPKGVAVPGPLGGGKVSSVDWINAVQQASRQAFSVMLVCRIESDQHLDVIAKRRAVSPTKFEIMQIVDLRDKYRPGEIHPSSYYHPDKGKADAVPIIVGNSKDEAQDYANGKRESRQLGKYAGSFTTPRLTFGYDVGDRIRRIAGRDASLQINLDANKQEAPVYPRVVGKTWSMRDGHSTSIILSDKRSDHNG